MAVDKRQSRKVVDYVQYEKADGVRMDPGPHVGIVTHVFDSTRSGRLIVYLPSLGGDPDNVDNCRIVNYASPYYGHTNFQAGANGHTSMQNTFENTRHSYGMWFNPPDVGVKVLVVFETGDTNNGYWFACIPETNEHYQTGTLAGEKASKLEHDASVSSLISGYGAAYAPAVEFNAADYSKDMSPTVHATVKRPPHRNQTKILAEQGLLGDPFRGINDSSSSRESPSGVFGISTPGRPTGESVTNDLLQRTSEDPRIDPTTVKEKITRGRKGGHSFVMDDGDVNGNSRFTRWRSAAGHQIVMDDVEGFLYISNSKGTGWVELTHDGNIFVYADQDISIRSGRDMSFKVGRDFKMEVDRDYGLRVKGEMQVENTVYKEWTANSRIIGVKDDFIISVQDNMATAVKGDYDILGVNSIRMKTDYDIELTSLDLIAKTEQIVSIEADGMMILNGETIQLNSLGGIEPTKPENAEEAYPDEEKIQGSRIDLDAYEGAEPIVGLFNPLPRASQLDTIKDGGIWKHNDVSLATFETILDTAIPTHEPFLSRYKKAWYTPLIGR